LTRDAGSSDHIIVIDGNQMTEPSVRLLIRLPASLARRFRNHVAPQQRSTFIERLLKEALPAEDFLEDDPLYRAAIAVDRDERLASEMAVWEEAIADGIEGDTERAKAV
jgi:hypothetical protein